MAEETTKDTENSYPFGTVKILTRIWAANVRLLAGPSGRSPAEIVGSNPTGDMDVCLL